MQVLSKKYQHKGVAGLSFLIIIALIMVLRYAHLKVIAASVLALSCSGPNKNSIMPATMGASPVTFDNMLGVNLFEWNVLQGDGWRIDEAKMPAVNNFTGIRHYLDWGRIEPQQGKYSFNPSHNGNWNYDAMYQRCKADNIDVLVCFKTTPDWLLQSYPSNQRDPEDVPMAYGADKSQPSSYLLQAKAAFQFAARYGANKSVDTALISIDKSPRWPNDPVNEKKAGLGLIKYIECNNEPDRWWKGDKAHQSAEEYAANLSAFYDGNKGKLGKGVGAKTADPNMMIVMGGLASANTDYVSKMIDWCKTNRGYKADGSVNLCFDIINYHLYTNDNKQHGGQATEGLAPELSNAGQLAVDFVKLGNTYKTPVWVTEAGFDINPKSPQRALSIGNKDQQQTQADWTIRTALLYSRAGIQKLFFYELYDDNLSSQTQYASSGLVNQNMTRRPAADYILQAKNLLTGYKYLKTINQSPIVDMYQSAQKKIYVLTLPDQTGRKMSYTLNIPGASQAVIHHLVSGAAKMVSENSKTPGGKLTLTVTETPTFVEF